MEMKKSSLISVIIPLYNHQYFIGECLQSVYNQTYRDLELIVVDDGSTDGSRETASQILQACPFPSQLIGQNNQGAHAAINRGIRASKGEYLSILNSDDCYHPRRLEILERQAKRSGSRFLFSEINHIDQIGNQLDSCTDHCYYYHLSHRSARFFPGVEFELLRHNLTITSSNFFIKQCLAEQVGDFADLITCHDWDYLLRVLRIESPQLINQVLLDYRVHPENTLRKESEYRNQEIDQSLSAYLAKQSNFENPSAPGPGNWGAYWKVFVDVYLCHLNIFPLTDQLLKTSLVGDPPSHRFQKWFLPIYRCWAKRVFGQFLWLEEKALEGIPDYKFRLNQLYNILFRWLLAKTARLLK